MHRTGRGPAGITRRQLLIGGSLVTIGATAVIATAVALPRLRQQRGPLFAEPERIRQALAALPAAVGSESVRLLHVQADGMLVEVLTTGGAVSASSLWIGDGDGAGSWSGPADSSVPVPEGAIGLTPADLPVDRVPLAAALVADARTVAVEVDGAGRTIMWVEHGPDARRSGVLPDGSALVPELDLDTSEGVDAVAREIIAMYGSDAVQLGSGDRHIAARLLTDGSPGALEVWRQPTLDCWALSERFDVPDPLRSFDLASVRAGDAVRFRAGVAEQLGLDGADVGAWKIAVRIGDAAPSIAYRVDRGVGPELARVDEDGTVTTVEPGW